MKLSYTQHLYLPVATAQPAAIFFPSEAYPNLLAEGFCPDLAAADELSGGPVPDAGRRWVPPILHYGIGRGSHE